MKKKLLSLVLALVMIQGLTVPALAASDLTGNQLYPIGNWDNGPSLVLKGVTAEHKVKLDPIHEYCYDVVVGGSLVLEMPYPAGKNRTYVILVGGGYFTSDFTPNYDLPNWSIPVAPEVEDISFGKDSGIRQYVYNFSESDIGKVDGCDQIIYVCLEWTDNEIGEDYVVDPGSGGVRFALRVIPTGAAVSPTGGFADVAASSPYKDAIGWAVEKGFTKGTGGGDYFFPDAPCTRGQIVTFLYRASK